MSTGTMSLTNYPKIDFTQIPETQEMMDEIEGSLSDLQDQMLNGVMTDELVAEYLLAAREMVETIKLRSLTALPTNVST